MDIFVDNPGMIAHYYTLAYLAGQFDRDLRSKRILSIFTQERSTLAIQLEDSPCLVISCEPRRNAVFLDPRYTRARRNTLNRFPELIGSTVQSVRMHGGDRIMAFGMDNGSQLEINLFGGRANVFWYQPGSPAAHSFLRPGKDRPATFDRQDERTVPLQPSMLRSADGGIDPVDGVLKRMFPQLGSLLVREVLFRAAVDPSVLWNTLDQENVESLITSLDSVTRDLNTPQPRIYTGPGGTTFSIIPLLHRGDSDGEPVDDIHEAIRRCLRGHTHRKKPTASDQPVLTRVEAELDKARRTQLAIQKDLQGPDRSEEYERYGKTLLSALHAIPAGESAVELPDGGERLRIPVDPSLTPAANAQRYFDKAKQSRTARREQARRLDEVSDWIDALDQVRAELMTKQDTASLRSRYPDLFERLGLTTTGVTASAPPFRMYRVEGGFEVWAGKNSKSNDELTLRHAKPNDLWFHARGAGGSHVILRVNTGRGEPGRRAKEQAASIAAYFSKMKGARLVPVAATRRKYVRKPKGAPPGTVLIEREEVLLVEPALPDQPPQQEK